MKSRNVFYPLSKGEFIFSCLLFTGIWLYIFLSTRIYEAGFNYFLDDHQIIIKHSDNFDIYKIIIEPIILSLNDRSRFRPLYEIFLRFFSTAYGLNPLLWYLSSLFVAIATTTNFYIFARLQFFPILESILFALLIVFGDQSSTYARFGTPETTATFLTSLAFIFGSLSIRDNINKRFLFLLNFLFLFFVMLTAFNKEACILMLPAFAFFKAWVFSRKNKVSLYQSLSINRYIVIFILSIFFLLIAYIKLRGVSGPGYAGIDHDSLSIIHLARIFKTLIEKSSFGLAIIVNII